MTPSYALLRTVLGASRPGRKAIVLDTSYTWSDFVRRGTTRALEARRVGDFFDEVWSVHPFPGSGSLKRCAPAALRINEFHVVIQGSGEISRLESFTSAVRFIASQVCLVATLVRYGRLEKVGVVRAGDPYYLGLIGYAVARLVGCPLVIRVSGNFDEIRRITGRPVMPRLFRTTRAEKVVERFVLRKADWVLAPNENNLEYALTVGARPDTSSVIRYGALMSEAVTDAASRASSADASRIRESEPRVVLIVSRLEPVKQVDDAIRAFAGVWELYPDAELWIAGDGSERERLEALCLDLGIEGHVSFWGDMSQDWLVSAYGRCVTLLAPQGGRALSEAALLGTPIVGYDRDWHVELIPSSDFGLLVPEGNWKGLGEAVCWVLENPAQAASMGEAVRRRARRMLDPERASRDERAIYERLVSKASAKRYVKSP